MPGNRFSEETVDRILRVSAKLFIEKGFERTTMQNIIDGLDGLSKGAVYHHFKSKEAILETAASRMVERGIAELEEIRDDPALTGLEKMRQMIDRGVNRPKSCPHDLSGVCLDPMTSSRIFALLFTRTLSINAHELLLPVIEQGMQDGTIHTDCPKQLAEVLCMLRELWCVPGFCTADAYEEHISRIRFFNEVMHGLGLDISLDESAGADAWSRTHE